MPGVKAMLTVDDLPPPADTITDNGTVIMANRAGERGLTNEPLYQGEPILAVAAVDELTAAEAIEKIKVDLRAAAVRGGSAGKPAARRPERRDGRQHLGARPSRLRPSPGRAPQRNASAEFTTVKWTDADFEDAKSGKLPMGKDDRGVDVWRRRSGLQERRAGAGRNLRHAEHQPSVPRNPQRDGVLAERKAVRSHRHAEHGADRARHCALAGHRSQQGRLHQRIHRRRVRQQDYRRHHADHPGAAFEEDRRAGDDAHHARGRDTTSAARGPACTAA